MDDFSMVESDTILQQNVDATGTCLRKVLAIEKYTHSVVNSGIISH